MDGERIDMMHPENRRLLALLIVPLLLLSPLVLQAASASGEDAPWFGVALDGYPLTEARLNRVEEEIGVRPDLVVFYLQWPKDPESGVFPRGSLQAVRERGAVPCVTWEPMYVEEGRERTVSWRRILEGEYDPYLISFAEQARAWGGTFIIRPAHEMNLERYHWGTTGEAYGPESPGIYRRMFRYIVRVFDEAGASNVLWAFCPNAESVPHPSYDPEASWNRAADYYPGDSYVDLLGMDGYNWGATQTKEENGWDSSWESFRKIFGPIHRELRRLAPDKPVFVFETASVCRGGDRLSWIQEAAETLRAWRIRGMVWFQADKEQDWRLRAGEASLLAPRSEPRAGAPGPLEWTRERTQ